MPTERCPSCGQEIPEERIRLHKRGLDGASPECPLTDLVEVAMRARGDWDGMRLRYLAPGDVENFRQKLWRL
jgi:hypothetical protein